MTQQVLPERNGERGSALVIAVLVTVILALLGISFLLLGETEDRIAQNEKLSVQALYVGEAAARCVKRWFDDPGNALHFPAITDIQRNQRQIIDETDPYDYSPATLTGQGEPGWVRYKETGSAVFDRPFRTVDATRFEHTMLGTETGPDMRIDESTAATFLQEMSDTLIADFPAGSEGVQAQISSIDIYAPPYVQLGPGGPWNRYGMATVKVVIKIYKATAGAPKTVAEREIKSVLGEMPYYGTHGPLHSCDETTLTGPDVHWGVLTSGGRTKLYTSPLPTDLTLPGPIPKSLPRAQPWTSRIDLVWSPSEPKLFSDFKTELDGFNIEDPWFRVVSEGEILNANSATQQPEGFSSTARDPCCDWSGLSHNLPLATCPTYDYDEWKNVASTGGRDVHYFSWNGTAFQENGIGPAKSFYTATHNQTGVFFFDTEDELAPFDTDGDGRFDNLTPNVVIPAGPWCFRGVAYLNAESIRIDGATSSTCTAVAFQPPGEPFEDLNQDGIFDAGELWINLDYPTSALLMDNPIAADQNDTFGGAGVPMRNDRGPSISSNASFHGLLYTNGSYEAIGTGRIYGSVVARQGVTQAIDNGSQPTPEIFWDQSLVDGWPPPGMDLPRVVITGWIVER